jgi:GAF domain-containing protein
MPDDAKPLPLTDRELRQLREIIEAARPTLGESALFACALTLLHEVYRLQDVALDLLAAQDS